MPSDSPTLLFAYGSSLPGLQGFFPEESPARRRLGLARTEGRLAFDGIHGVLLPGPGQAFGELLEIDPANLPRLDAEAQCAEDDPPRPPLQRNPLDVTHLDSGETLTVEAYQPPAAARAGLRTRTAVHDYRGALLKGDIEENWYLAFGSNLDPDRLRGRVGDFTEECPGLLPGFRLVFNKEANEGHAYANLASDPDGPGCPGVAYRLRPDQIRELDGYEGTPRHYVRLGLPFVPEDSPATPFLGFAYVAQPERLVRQRPPTTTYLEHLRRGYRLRGWTREIEVPS